MVDFLTFGVIPLLMSSARGSWRSVIIVGMLGFRIKKIKCMVKVVIIYRVKPYKYEFL